MPLSFTLHYRLHSHTDFRDYSTVLPVAQLRHRDGDLKAIMLCPTLANSANKIHLQLQQAAQQANEHHSKSLYTLQKG